MVNHEDDRPSVDGSNPVNQLDDVLKLRDVPPSNRAEETLLLQQSDIRLGAMLRAWLTEGLSKTEGPAAGSPSMEIPTKPRDYPVDPADLRHARPEHTNFPFPGDTCGPFKIEKPLGHGGMGTVFLASRIDDLDLKVALKTLSFWDSRAESLFRRECKILSGLSHPNIAHLIDAGVLATGQPWLAMEYVEGQTLDVYLETTELTLDQRLSLFLKICDALSHAHGQLVIHRDLKPRNIVIKPNGEPKLLDFGIARIIDPESRQQAAQTTLAERIMTPEYASPEQVRGERLGAATDVYSAGVLLYELLTGVRPYQIHSYDFYSIAKAMEEGDIKPPSVQNLKTGTTNKSFARNLRGDLDTITLKALAVSPTDRYASVAEFAHDIRLYQRGMPIEARPASRAYRMRKFIARHQWPVVLGTGLLVFLSVFSIYAQIQQGRLARERDLANREQRTAAQVTEFLVSLFDQADPQFSQRSDLSAFEILERGRSEIQQTLDSDPEIAARLTATLGRVYRGLGDAKQSRALLTDAVSFYQGTEQVPFEMVLELFRTLLLAGDFLVAEGCLAQLSERQEKNPLQQAQLDLAYGKLCLKIGRYRQAETAFQAALSAAVLPREDRIALKKHQAVLQRRLGNMARSLEMQKEHLAIEKAYYGETHVHVADSQIDLSLSYLRNGDWDKANELQEQAGSIYEKAYGRDHLNWSKFLNYRAQYFHRKGELEQAVTSLNKGITIIQEKLGLDSYEESILQSTLGFAYFRKGEYQLAEETLRKALSTKHRLLGPEHIESADCLLNLSLVFGRRGQLQKEQDLLLQALAIYRERLPQTHPTYGKVISNLAIVYARQGQWSKAEEYFLETLKLRRETYGDVHPSVADTLFNLGAFYSAQDKLELAEEYQRKCLALRRQIYKTAHPDLGGSLANLGTLADKKGNLDEARKLLEESVAMFVTLKKETHWVSRNAKIKLASVQVKQGDYAEAEPTLLQLLTWASEKEGPESAVFMDTTNELGLLYLQQGRFEKATSHYQDALRIAQSLFKSPHARITEKRLNLVEVYLEHGKNNQASALLQVAEEDLEKTANPKLAARLGFLKASSLRQTGNDELAYQHFKRLWEATAASEASQWDITAKTLLQLADLEVDFGTSSQALAYLNLVRSRLENRLPKNHEIFQEWASIKGKVLLHDGDPSGKELLQTAHRQLTQKLGEEHPLTRKANRRLSARPSL